MKQLEENRFNLTPVLRLSTRSKERVVLAVYGNPLLSSASAAIHQKQSDEFDPYFTPARTPARRTPARINKTPTY